MSLPWNSESLTVLEKLATTVSPRETTVRDN